MTNGNIQPIARPCPHCGTLVYTCDLVGAGWTGERRVVLEVAAMCYQLLSGARARAAPDVMPMHRCFAGLGVLSSGRHK